MKKKRPILSLEWLITGRCNYNCSYCCQGGQSFPHCSDATTEAMFKLLSQLEGSWYIKLSGGEPFIHPRFFEMCERIVMEGHSLCINTNFSAPLPQLKRLITICGDKLKNVFASLHLEQVNIDEFINKASEFNALKTPATGFCVNCVIIKEKFKQLKEIEERLKEKNINFLYQLLLSPTGFHTYSPSIEKYVSKKLMQGTTTLRNKDLFGTYCYSGSKFFVIWPNGSVTRCYSGHPIYFALGNIRTGTFVRLKGAAPCLSPRCTCCVPLNRNMVLFKKKASQSQLRKICLQLRAEESR